MNKLLLLGFSLLCLLRDGEPGLIQDKEENFLVCAVCERFKNGICYKGDNACLTTGTCRSWSYYSNTKNGWEYTHAVLDCAESCGKPVIRKYMSPGSYEVRRCCGRNNCNRENSLA